MMTKVILLRHGESIGNRKHVFLGHTDWDLSEKGYKQAQAAAEYLKKYQIDVIYASDLKRAYNTAVPTARTFGLEIVADKNLREIYAGKWEGISYDEIEEKYAKDYKIWHNDKENAVCTGGESTKELRSRIVKTYNQIVAENRGKTILIATHSTPILLLTHYVMGKNIDCKDGLPWAPNASVTVIDAEKNEIILKGYADYLADLKTMPAKKM